MHNTQIFYPTDPFILLEKPNLIGEPFEIAGIHHHKDNAMSFFHGAQACDKKDHFYGLILMPEPDNPHDNNAISVWGAWSEKGWFKTTDHQQKLGYVPRNIASDIAKTTPHSTHLQADIDEMSLSTSGFLEIWIQIYSEN